MKISAWDRPLLLKICVSETMLLAGIYAPVDAKGDPEK